MIRIAVILFPGINCEDETLDSVRSAGMDGRVVRWNEKPELLKHFDGYVIPGGWSYEDRIRAGCISARDPIMIEIKKQAEKGKPVLGICNGAQVLVESGLVPDVKGGIEMALAPNINPFISGYYVTWIYLKLSSLKKTAFTIGLDKDTVFRIPIAHGEGRFKTADRGLLDELKKNDQIILRYCDENGEIVYDFPVNPNGSMFNTAAVCNKNGNVMAMMPHPERANWLRQVPGSDLTKGEQKGPARFIFESMKKYIEGRK
ncbi:phosphoribosylformylglycinamidine synthase I [Candidatus Woesearchaeota archaeon]|nr:phosphoribosylformylglycinamidine synthase I [Candidatus Woesearchaeota archaeon]